MKLSLIAKGIWKSVIFSKTVQTWNWCALRLLYSKTKIWEKKYKKETRIELETYWMKKLSEKWRNKLKSFSNLKSTPLKKEKFYCLSMFPYPSGKLHMGHVRVYTISDTMANFHRMQGRDVIHPMGWDSFGLPAENAALLNKLDPEEWTEKNIEHMKHQLNDLNLFFDWDRELSTCHPSYYKWTQYLFLKLFEAGLAYQKKALVNWDPVDNTVLADEQVDENGCSWRSGAHVEKKLLKQWFFRTTKYAESLLSSIDEIDENVGIKAMQRHWIGEIDGCFVDFKLQIDGAVSDEVVAVFCTQPELLPEATHINIQSGYCNEITNIFEDAGVASSSVDMLRSSSEGMLFKSLQGILLPDVLAVNPFTNERIPFVISDHQAETYKAPNVLGVPSLHKRDEEIQLQHGLLCADHQRKFTRREALDRIKSLGCGQGYMTSSCLRDWLISRQRRWGTPIPMVHCLEHGFVPVAEENLPVVLPKYNESLETWKKTTCPKCGGPAERETDTLDTFVDSSWYFMRFTDPHNNHNIFSKEVCDHEMPVDLYIGGKEHAILHLYYARFISHFCADIGLSVHREPFKKLLAQGIIKGKTYRLKSSGKYLSPTEVQEEGALATEISTGEEVETSFDKMSKSKLNGVDPVEFVEEWGINLTRLFVLYAAAPKEVIHWDVKTDVIPGMMRWQLKLWRCVGRLIEDRKKPFIERDYLETEFDLAERTNYTIDKVTNLFEESCVLSAAITLIMTLTKVTNNLKDSVVTSSYEYERSVCAQVIMASPMMPHLASELWAGLCGMEYKLTDHAWDKDVLDQKWPSTTTVPASSVYSVWVNKKRCTKLRLPLNLTNQENIEKRALSHPKVKKLLKGMPVASVQINDDYIKFSTETT